MQADALLSFSIYTVQGSQQDFMPTTVSVFPASINIAKTIPQGHVGPISQVVLDSFKLTIGTKDHRYH